jgi:hypothetical protein
MTFKHMFLSTAAASSLLFAIAAIEPAAFSLATPLATKAQAATNIPASINFYDELAPYGVWVLYQNRYVWIPEDVDARWRPYSEGHWAYTRRHSWIWVSDERFGWATYHYGRWGHAPYIGWYWVPGRRWAPAWVAWSYDHHDIAWAPLPPSHNDGGDDVISLRDIPDDYWQAMSLSAFLSADLSSHLFRDRDRVRRVIQRGKSWTVSIEDSIVVNNVITIDNIETQTKQKVVVLEEKAVDNPEAVGRADSNSVAIFNPEMKEEPDAKPKKVMTVAEFVKAREAKGNPMLATGSTDQPPKPVEKAKIIPSFDTVKVEPTGEALIAGRAAPGSEVAVKFNGVTVGKAMANADGAFVIIPDKPLPSGPGALSLESKSNGVVVASADKVAVDVKAVPKPASQPSKYISLDTVDYDQEGKFVFSGRGPAGSKVQLNIDNNTYGLAHINDKGTWTYAFLSPITVGIHTLRVVEIGGDGTVNNPIQMLFYREEPAKVATAPPTPATPEAPKPAEAATTAPEVPAPVPPVDSEKKAAASAEQPVVPVEKKKKKAIASTEQPAIEKTVKAPADEQAAPVIPKIILRDAGAESWKINCSPAFGGWSKASQYYISTAGKRVSCAMPPKNVRG